jgi:hypothetical protein
MKEPAFSDTLSLKAIRLKRGGNLVDALSLCPLCPLWQPISVSVATNPPFPSHQADGRNRKEIPPPQRLCASARVLPIRNRRFPAGDAVAFSSWPWEVGRFHAIALTFYPWPQRSPRPQRGKSLPSWSQSEKACSLRRHHQTMATDQSDHCINRGRGRNRDRFLCWLAHCPHGPLKLRCRVVSVPQQYGLASRFLVSESHPASLRYRNR